MMWSTYGSQYRVIDRATIGATVVSTGVKLDNLIDIAHNVEIGAHTVIAAQTGIRQHRRGQHHSPTPEADRSAS
jgi:hypothetical protein